MRSRSLLVVLSLLAFAFAAGPVQASKSRTTKQKKIAAQKRADAAKRKAPVEQTTEPTGLGTIVGGRDQAAATDRPARGRPAAKKTATTTEAPATRRPGRVAARKPIATPQQHAGSSSAIPAATTTSRTSLDSSAAVAPRRRFVKLKRFFAGLAIVTALSAGAMGWQAADMNSKVGDAYTYVSDTVEKIIWGGHDDPIGGNPNKGDPKPDPGPPLPVPDPVPDPEPDPGPSPSGGKGHQTPKGPETDSTLR